MIKFFSCLFFILIYNFKYTNQIINLVIIFNLILLNNIISKINKKENIFILNLIFNRIKSSGCLTIKFAQWFISRMKLNYKYNEYPEWLRLFDKLYDDCNIHDFKYTTSIIENHFNDKIENIFQDISTEPLSSGSIAQVHKCIYNNKECVIKIKHPNLLDNCYIFYNILYFVKFCLSLSLKKYFYKVLPPINIKNFIENIEKQIYLNIEANNMKRMYNEYEDNDYIIIPKCYYSTDDFIIMSYEEGTYFKDLQESEGKKYKIILLLLMLFKNMSLIKQNVHGDLHCCNWKVRPYGVDHQIILYDFGITFQIEDWNECFIAWDTYDHKKIIDEIELIIDYNPYSKERFNVIKKELYKNTDTLLQKPLKMTSILQVLSKWANKHNIIYNSTFLNYAITGSLLEYDFKEYLINRYGQNNNQIKYIVPKSDFLTHYNFCKTKQLFPELQKKLQEYISMYTQINELFYDIENKLQIYGAKIDSNKSKYISI